MFGRKPAARPAARPAPRKAAPATPAPAPAAHPPAAPAQQSGGMLSGIGSTIAQGMAFGTGSAVAHRAVGAVAGSMSGGGDAEMPAEQQQIQGYAEPTAAGAPGTAPAQLEGPCAQDKQMFYECLQVNRGDQEACRFLYETLQTCTREQSSMNFS